MPFSAAQMRAGVHRVNREACEREIRQFLAGIAADIEAERQEGGEDGAQAGTD